MNLQKWTLLHAFVKADLRQEDLYSDISELEEVVIGTAGDADKQEASSTSPRRCTARPNAVNVSVKRIEGSQIAL